MWQLFLLILCWLWLSDLFYVVFVRWLSDYECELLPVNVLFRYFYKRIELNFLWPFHKTASKLITYTQQQQPSFFLASRYVVDAASPFSFKGPLSLLNIYRQTLQPDVTHWAGEKQRHLKLGFNFCPCLVYSLPDHFKMWNECAFQILFFKPELHSLILNWKLAVIQAKKKDLKQAPNCNKTKLRLHANCDGLPNSGD